MTSRVAHEIFAATEECWWARRAARAFGWARGGGARGLPGAAAAGCGPAAGIFPESCRYAPLRSPSATVILCPSETTQPTKPGARQASCQRLPTCWHPAGCRKHARRPAIGCSAWRCHPWPVFSSDHAGAVFFDVDGTLVPGTSSSVFLAGFLGHRDELAKAEDAYASGGLDNRQVSVLDAERGVQRIGASTCGGDCHGGRRPTGRAPRPEPLGHSHSLTATTRTAAVRHGPHPLRRRNVGAGDALALLGSRRGRRTVGGCGRLPLRHCKSFPGRHQVRADAAPCAWGTCSRS